jgi:hypothetical protein
MVPMPIEISEPPWVCAGGPHRQSDFGCEKPVQQQLDDGHDDQQRQRPLDIIGQPAGQCGKNGRVVDQRHVRLAHHPQIDRIQRDHHQNAGQQIHDFQRDVEPAGNETGQRPCRHRSSGRQEWIDAARDQHRRHGPAQRKTAVHGQIGEIENAERDQDAERHQTEDQADFKRAPQRIQRHNKPSSMTGRRSACRGVVLQNDAGTIS